MAAGTNFFQSSVTAVNAVAGCGLLAMPYTIAQGGWLSLAALFIMAVICTSTAMLMQQCMDSNEFAKSYSDIGKLAFGNKGKTLMTVLMNVELYFVVIGLLIVVGDNIDTVLPGVEVNILGMNIKGKQCFIILAALVILPVTWQKDLRLLSYLSLTNFIVFFLLIVLVFWIGAFQGVGFREKGDIVNWLQLPGSLSIYIFSFAGHTIIPTIYASMKDSKKFSKVLIIGFTTSTLIYALMAILGYLMFGTGTKSMVTLNLPQTLLTSKIAIWTITVIPLVKYALAIMPVVNSLEEQFQVTKRFRSILLRTSLVASTAAIALGMPYFTTCISLTGSLISSMTTIIMPCLCYLSIFKSSIKWGLKLLMIKCFIIVGGLVVILGTYVSIKQIILDY